jgi:phosphatidylinositol glycan class U
MLYTIIDILGAYALMQVAESGQAVGSRLFKSSRKGLRWSSVAIAAGYVFMGRGKPVN